MKPTTRSFNNKCSFAILVVCLVVWANGTRNRKLVETAAPPEEVALRMEPSPTSPLIQQNAVGQHLLLDLIECSDETVLKDSIILSHMVREIADALQLPVVNLAVTHLEPHGSVAVVANRGNSHLTIHTYPLEKAALVDILITDENNTENLHNEDVLGLL